MANFPDAKFQIIFNTYQIINFLIKTLVDYIDIILSQLITDQNSCIFGLKTFEKKFNFSEN